VISLRCFTTKEPHIPLKHTGSCKTCTSTGLLQPVFPCGSHLQLGCCTGFGTPEINLEVQTVGLVDTCAILETNTRNIENSQFTQHLCLLNTFGLSFPGLVRTCLKFWGSSCKLAGIPVKTHVDTCENSNFGGRNCCKSCPLHPWPVFAQSKPASNSSS